MKIKMLTTKKVAEDGINIKKLERGKEYNISDKIADTLVAKGWAQSLEVILEAKVIEVEKRAVVKVKKKSKKEY